MHYWCGEAKDYNEAKTNYGEQRNTSKKVEFLGVLVRLKVGLFTHGTRQVSGIVTPDIGSEVTIGSLEEPCKSPLLSWE